MKVVVVYDSMFGNTQRIARAIGETLGAGEPVPVLAASIARERDLVGIDLLAVGGPTQGHGLSPSLRAFLDLLPPEVVRDVPTVTFDTRLSWPRFLSGSAAEACAKRLVQKGARLLVPPESFVVKGKKGPLASGEFARAIAWANRVRAAAGLPVKEPAVTAS